jgi:hypothetical protein
LIVNGRLLVSLVHLWLKYGEARGRLPGLIVAMAQCDSWASTERRVR